MPHLECGFSSLVLLQWWPWSGKCSISLGTSVESNVGAMLGLAVGTVELGRRVLGGSVRGIDVGGVVVGDGVGGLVVGDGVGGLVVGDGVGLNVGSAVSGALVFTTGTPVCCKGARLNTRLGGLVLSTGDVLGT